MKIKSLLAAVVASLLASAAIAGSTSNDGAAVGLTDLINRIGIGNIPTGAGVRVGHVEGLFGGAYGPDQLSGEFTGKTFTLMSGPTGTSSHANNVAMNFYGNTISIAPGITQINNYEAANWMLSGYLLTQGVASAVQPLNPPAGMRIFNHSWIGALNPASASNDALRRADFVAGRDNVLIVCGMGNAGDPNQPLLGHVYNGLAVGKQNGAHQFGNTNAGFDGPGRAKPEIVAPGGATSWATPVVSAAAALLIQTARTAPNLINNPNAERSEITKVVLLDGAVKHAGWTNNPSTSGPTRGISSTPLDDVYGADLVNINNSHLILTGGEQNGSASIPSAPSPLAAWDLVPLTTNSSAFWRFNITQPAAEVAITATWHRKVDSTNFASFAHADFNLTLWKLNASSQLVPLFGPGGVGVFADGNVVSQSPIDNVEHLYLTGLAPGQYALQLQRVDNIFTQPVWDAAVAWRFPAQPAPLCAADIFPIGSGDGMVGPGDLGQLLSKWGICASPCPADIAPVGSPDGAVGPADLGQLLSQWGQCK